MNFSSELKLLGQAVKKSRLTLPTRKKIARELITNGIAGIITFFISVFLHSFMVESTPVKKIGHALHIGKDKDKILVEKGTFDFIQWTAIFIIGLFVFTVVESIMENYLDLRAQKNLDKERS